MKLSVREMAVFALFSALMLLSKFVEILPNVHQIGALLVALTVVYRQKALYPLYVYVLLNGIFAGFSTWWIPYLYVWTVLWAGVMLLPKNLSPAVGMVVYPLVCGLHGLLFGILYAPGQALLFGMNWNQIVAWIAVGLPFDIWHAMGNVCAGLLIVPVVTLLRKLETIEK